MPKQINNKSNKVANPKVNFVDIVKNFEESINEAVIQNDVELSYDIAKEIAKVLEENKQDLRRNLKAVEKLNSLLARAQWIHLHWLSEKEAFSLFENHLMEGVVDDDIYIWDKTKTFLLSNYIISVRNDIKRRIRQAMMRSKEKLSKPVSAGDFRISTVADWLEYYNREIGAGQIEKTFDLFQFVTKNEASRNIDQKTRTYLIKLLQLYEQLKKDSTEMDGFEGSLSVEDASSGRRGVISDGEVKLVNSRIEKQLEIAGLIREVALGKRPKADLEAVLSKTGKKETVKENKPQAAPGVISKRTTPEIAEPVNKITDREQEIMIAYRGDVKQAKAIETEQQKIGVKIGGDIAALRQEFIAAMQKKNQIRTIAILKLLAVNGGLLTFLTDDKKLRDFMITVWQKELGADFVSEFEKNSQDVKFIKQFLKYILEERLQMNENDSARVGMQIGNLFVNNGKKGYNKIAYFDVNTNSFHWF